MIVEILAIGLLITALLAVNVKNPVYSVASLACVFILVAILYYLSGAYFAALFQFIIGIGTLAVLFVVAETLDGGHDKAEYTERPYGTIIAALLLSIPMFIFTIPVVRIIPEPAGGLPYALWDLRSLDVVLQGVVILIIALGMVIILRHEKEGVD